MGYSCLWAKSHITKYFAYFRERIIEYCLPSSDGPLISCSVKEFTGETYLRYNQKPQSNETGEYYFKYVLNDVASTRVFKEYLIYDAIGMVGSVGGTLGMVIEL